MQLSLTPNVVLDATPAGSLVGTLSVTSLLAGQFLPPTYRLVPGQGNDAAFLLGGDGLFTQFMASYAGQQTYQVVVHVNVGFGDDAVTVQVVVSPVHFPVRAITAELFLKRAGRRKPARLAVRVRYADTGMEKEEFLSPFQRPAYRNIRVSVRDGNGDGVPDQVVLTARKGRRTFRMTVTA